MGLNVVEGFGFRVLGFGFRARVRRRRGDSGLRVSSWIWVQDLGFQAIFCLHQRNEMFLPHSVFMRLPALGIEDVSECHTVPVAPPRPQ